MYDLSTIIASVSIFFVLGMTYLILSIAEKIENRRQELLTINRNIRKRGLKRWQRVILECTKAMR